MKLLIFIFMSKNILSLVTACSSKQGAQRMMVLVVNFFLVLIFFFFFGFVIPIFDLAHNVEAIIFYLAYLLTAPGNLFCNMQFHRASLIFQKRFFLDNIIAST